MYKHILYMVPSFELIVVGTLFITLILFTSNRNKEHLLFDPAVMQIIIFSADSVNTH